MIDYLELLLDKQGQEETEETPGMELGVFRTVEVRTGSGAAAPQTVDSGPAGAEQPTVAGAGEAPDGHMEKKSAEADGVPGRPIRVRAVSIRAAGDPTEESVGPAQTAKSGAGAAAVENNGPRGEGAAGAGGVSIGGDAEAAERDTNSLWATLRRGQSGILSAGGVPSLYRQMVRAGQAVGGLRQNARVLTVTENADPLPAPGAAELDEIFARDARRYDGGFSLY